MKLKKTLITFSVCLNIGFIIIAGYTAMRHMYHNDQRRHAISKQYKIFDDFNLSADQKSKIDSMVSQYLQDIGNSHQRTLKETLSIYALLGKPGEIDEKVLNATFQSILQTEAIKEKIRLEHLKDIRQVLNAQQAGIFFRDLAAEKQKRAPNTGNHP